MKRRFSFDLSLSFFFSKCDICLFYLHTFVTEIISPSFRTSFAFPSRFIARRMVKAVSATLIYAISSEGTRRASLKFKVYVYSKLVPVFFLLQKKYMYMYYAFSIFSSSHKVLLYVSNIFLTEIIAQY